MHPLILAKIFYPMHRLSLEEVVPEHYGVFLDLQDKGFSGKVQITVKVLQDTKVIRLNSKGLVIASSSARTKDKTISLDATTEKDLLTLSSPETLSGSLELEIGFSGTYSTDLEGLYRSGSIIATHLEPAGARRVIPCFDQPDMKATFSVTVAVSEDYTVLSNTPVVSSKDRTYEFEKTPRMSTYLLAIVAGPLAHVSGSTSRGTEVRVYAEPGSESLGYFSLYTAIRCLEFFEQYFAAHYPLPKLDLVALPAFAMGAMENWGLVTFRASSLLYDPETTPVFSQRNIAVTVCHELAHMWFGNLVTMEWWSDLWLNEGFATWASMLAVRELGLFEIPEKLVKDSDSSKGGYRSIPTASVSGELSGEGAVVGSWNPFLVEETEHGMGRDALRSTHPIAADVRDPVEVDQIFDEISYAKGAALIRMVEDWVGPHVFRDGLRKYIAAYSHSNTTTAMLWDAIDATATEYDKSSNPSKPVVTDDTQITSSSPKTTENHVVVGVLGVVASKQEIEEEGYAEKRVCIAALTASKHPGSAGTALPPATHDDVDMDDSSSGRQMAGRGLEAEGERTEDDSIANAADSAYSAAGRGVPLAKVVLPWITRSGFPYISVKTTERNTVMLAQDRFTLGFVPEGKAEPWPIPLTIRWEDCSTTRILFSDSVMEVPRKTELFKLNPGYTGFYRVLYDDSLYSALLKKAFRKTSESDGSDQRLKQAKEDENAADRLNLLADRRALSAGSYGVRRSLSEFVFLAEEDNDEVLAVGLGDLRELASLFYDEKLKKEVFQRAMRLLVSKRALKIVSAEEQRIRRRQMAAGDGDKKLGDDTSGAAYCAESNNTEQGESSTKLPMSVRSRESLLVQQGLAAEDEALKSRLTNFSKNLKFIGDLRTSAELQKAAYMAVADERFDELVAIYREKTRSPGQRTDALWALGSCSKVELGDRLLQEIESIVEKQDMPRIFAALSANATLREQSASFMMRNFRRIKEYIANAALTRLSLEYALKSVGSSMDAELDKFLAEYVAGDAELAPAAAKVHDTRLRNARMRKNVEDWDLSLEVLEALESE